MPVLLTGVVGIAVCLFVSCSPPQEVEIVQTQPSLEDTEPVQEEPQTEPAPVVGENEKLAALPNLPDGALPLLLVKIPAGTFQMGSPESERFREENEGPVHPVAISKDFYLGNYEVTQAQWLALMETNPSTQLGDNLPVNRVNWQDAQEFLQKLNELFGESGYRLPTEAEWEYACRAGTTTATYFGDEVTEEQMADHAWYRGNSEGELHPVGQLQANAWGLFDLYGNVWEWCSDWYGPYTADAVTDPRGPETGEEKVFRGASWMGRFEYLRSADRAKFKPENRQHTGGFRIAWSD
jgi:formylglycine-generating enzyme required for sulfatase activity